MAPEANTQTFTFETVAALVAALMERGGNVGQKDYEAMAAMDGTRSASGFEHLFRKVKARAKELMEARGTAPATPDKKGKGNADKDGATPGTGGKSTGKRTRKGKKGGEDSGDEESPKKKVKAEPVEDAFYSDEEDGGAKL